jgi:PDZ domain-containing secreted protein
MDICENPTNCVCVISVLDEEDSTITVGSIITVTVTLVRKDMGTLLDSEFLGLEQANEEEEMVPNEEELDEEEEHEQEHDHDDKVGDVRHLLLAVQLLIEINKVVLTCRDVWG